MPNIDPPGAYAPGGFSALSQDCCRRLHSPAPMAVAKVAFSGTI